MQAWREAAGRVRSGCVRRQSLSPETGGLVFHQRDERLMTSAVPPVRWRATVAQRLAGAGGMTSSTSRLRRRPADGSWFGRRREAEVRWRRRRGFAGLAVTGAIEDRDGSRALARRGETWTLNGLLLETGIVALSPGAEKRGLSTVLAGDRGSWRSLLARRNAALTRHLTDLADHFAHVFFYAMDEGDSCPVLDGCAATELPCPVMAGS